MPRRRRPPNPFRYFDSSPEVIRLVAMMYVTRQEMFFDADELHS
jgi:hypothetical protein